METLVSSRELTWRGKCLVDIGAETETKDHFGGDGGAVQTCGGEAPPARGEDGQRRELDILPQSVGKQLGVAHLAGGIDKQLHVDGDFTGEASAQLRGNCG